MVSDLTTVSVEFGGLRNALLAGGSPANAAGLLTNKERQPDMEHALTLAITHAISAYDAQYVDLAEALGVLLVTEDKKLQRTLPHRVISLMQAAGDDGSEGRP